MEGEKDVVSMNHTVAAENRPAAESSAARLSAEENEVIETYRRAKRIGYADLVITIQDGRRVKLWLTEKMK